MKKKPNYPLWVLVSIMLVVAIVIFSDPLQRPDFLVRQYVLKRTPIGMSMEDVVEVIEGQEEWVLRNINYDGGYLSPNTRLPAEPTTSGEYSIGEKSIRALVGEYQYLLVTSVTVFWGFDENSELIEVEIWKTVDGP